MRHVQSHAVQVTLSNLFLLSSLLASTRLFNYNTFVCQKNVKCGIKRLSVREKNTNKLSFAMFWGLLFAKSSF